MEPKYQSVRFEVCTHTSPKRKRVNVYVAFGFTRCRFGLVLEALRDSASRRRRKSSVKLYFNGATSKLTGWGHYPLRPPAGIWLCRHTSTYSVPWNRVGAWRFNQAEMCWPKTGTVATESGLRLNWRAWVLG